MVEISDFQISDRYCMLARKSCINGEVGKTKPYRLLQCGRKTRWMVYYKCSRQRKEVQDCGYRWLIIFMFTGKYAAHN